MTKHEKIKMIGLGHLRPLLPPSKHLLPHLQCSVGYLSALVLKLRIGMIWVWHSLQSVESNACYADEYNILTAHA